MFSFSNHSIVGRRILYGILCATLLFAGLQFYKCIRSEITGVAFLFKSKIDYREVWKDREPDEFRQVVNQNMVYGGCVLVIGAIVFVLIEAMDRYLSNNNSSERFD